MTNETPGEAVRRRRKALGLSDRAFERETKINRATLDRVESDDPKVQELTWDRVHAALDRMERRLGVDDPGHMVGRVEMPDGTVYLFPGSPDDVALAMAKFEERRASATRKDGDESP